MITSYAHLTGGRAIVTESVFVFQAEDGIRDLVRSRGLGDVYKRQMVLSVTSPGFAGTGNANTGFVRVTLVPPNERVRLSLIHI